MQYEWMDAYLLEKKGVTRDLQADWNWIRYQIGGLSQKWQREILGIK